MDVNLRHNEYFVQDASWHESSARYGGFIEKMARKPLVCLELGVGFNTPGITGIPSRSSYTGTIKRPWFG
jgi:hypothetical protein